MKDNISQISEIKLRGVLPRVFDDKAGRERFDRSQVMLADLSFRRGEVYCLNARSGTGKTSLCSFIYGSRHDYCGSISFNDADVSTLGVKSWCEVRRRHLAYLPQELDIFDELTAMDNVRLKNRLTGCKTDTEITDMFRRLGIDNLLDRPAGRMSVGQKQRVAIVRALCQPYDFILLDEPVSHLDAYNNSQCAAMIMEDARRQDAGVIFTSVGNPLAVDAPVTQLTL